MLTLPSAPSGAIDWPAYRPFSARVLGVRRLSSHFVRVTFGGRDFGDFGTARLDQRVKVLFPLPGIGLCDVGADDALVIAAGDWYGRWRALPHERRNPFRTYTVRAVRPDRREIDVDFVVHGDGGPAARWLNDAAPGDEVILVGPDARSSQSTIGLDWHPGGAKQLLLAGDETAAPAICSILESLPADTTARAFIEVPARGDAMQLELNEGCDVTWLGRGDAPVGTALQPAVRHWVCTHQATIAPALRSAPQMLSELDVDRELLWDSPEDTIGAGFYAWLAGEAAVIKQLRRFLVTETGIDRSRVAFMGYWRLGKTEAQ